MNTTAGEDMTLTRDFASRYGVPPGVRVCRFGHEAHAVVKPEMQQRVAAAIRAALGPMYGAKPDAVEVTFSPKGIPSARLRIEGPLPPQIMIAPLLAYEIEQASIRDWRGEPDLIRITPLPHRSHFCRPRRLRPPVH